MAVKPLPIKLDLAINDVNAIGNMLIKGQTPDTVKLRKIGIYLKALAREIRNEIRDL